MVDVTINAKEHVAPDGSESWNIQVAISGFDSKHEWEKIYTQVRKQMRVIAPQLKDGGE